MRVTETSQEWHHAHRTWGGLIALAHAPNDPPFVDMHTVSHMAAFQFHVRLRFKTGCSALLLLTTDHMEECVAYLVLAHPYSMHRVPLLAPSALFRGTAVSGWAWCDSSANHAFQAQDLWTLRGKPIGCKGARGSWHFGGEDRRALLQAAVGPSGVIASASSRLQLGVAAEWDVLSLHRVMDHVDDGVAGLDFFPAQAPPQISLQQCRQWCPVAACRVAIVARWIGGVRRAKHGADHMGGRVYVLPKATSPGQTKAAISLKVFVFDGRRRHDLTEHGVLHCGEALSVLPLPSAPLHDALRLLFTEVPQTTRKQGGIAPRATLPAPWMRHFVDHRDSCGGTLPQADTGAVWEGAPCIIAHAAVSVHRPAPGRRRTALPNGGGWHDGPVIGLRVLRPVTAAAPGSLGTTTALTSAVLSSESPVPLHTIWTALCATRAAPDAALSVPEWPHVH